MTNLRQAAQQALEAWFRPHGINYVDFKPYMEALRAALAEPEQEPVAWMFQHEETGRTMCVDAQQVEWGFEKGNPRLKKIAPLYTAPTPRRPQTTHWEGCEAVHPECRKPEQKPVAWMSNKDFNPIRIRIMSEAYDFADRGDSEGYNAIKVMCGDVQRMLPPQRKPLTEGEMPTLFVGGLALNSEATTEIVRAVEKAHGIEQTFKEKNA